MPSVVISGLMPSTTTMKPLSMPKAMPHSTVTENAATGFQPSRVINSTPIELDRKAIDPREMSRFPVITTIAMPQDMITTGAIVCSMAIMLPNSRKCGVVRLKKTKMAASTSTKPQSSSSARSEAAENLHGAGPRARPVSAIRRNAAGRDRPRAVTRDSGLRRNDEKRVRHAPSLFMLQRPLGRLRRRPPSGGACRRRRAARP